MNWFKRLFAGTSRTIAETAEDKMAVAELSERMKAYGVPALQLRPASTKTFSRLGGLPNLPPGLEWPEWTGKPQAFLGQLDLAEVHHAMPSFLPAAGYLYFFYDQEQGVWGFDPKDAGAWRVLYSPATTSLPAEHPAPKGLDSDYVYHAKPVSLHPIISLPDSERLPPGQSLDDDDSDTYFTMREEPYEGMVHHQMFGFPIAVQNDGMEEECQFVTNGIYLGNAEGHRDPRAAALKVGAKEWKLLLQLDSDDDTGWMWGDVGTLYFWIRESDARQSDFSKVWMIFQCC